MLNTEKGLLILTGIIIAIGALVLVQFGNPANMGVCIACFIRDISGGLGLQRVPVVQYIRPEIIGIVLGAFVMALATKNFKPVGGSSTMLRFIIGTCVMIGALVFLGCPTRMILRLGAGDLNAVVGIFGFITGLFIGFKFEKSGVSLGTPTPSAKSEAMVFPFLNIGLLILVVLAPAFIFFSQKGPGAMHAPLLLSLGIAFVIGALSLKSGFCFAGGIARPLFKKEYRIGTGILTMLIIVLIGNMILGKFNLSFASQPIAHTDGIFNFLGMLIVGWGSVMLAGCPLRQLVKAGSGNSDAAVTIMGFLVGAAIAHNFSLAASPKGVPENGQIAVAIIVVLFLLIAVFNKKNK